jgi:hypothetical protein
MELGTGEALISFQNEKGAPEIVERATILPPQSRMGVITPEERAHIVAASPFVTKYDAVASPSTPNGISTQKTLNPEQAQAENLAKYSSQYGSGPLSKTPSTAAKQNTKPTTRKTKSTAEKAGERFAINAAGSIGRNIFKIFKGK